MKDKIRQIVHEQNIFEQLEKDGYYMCKNKREYSTIMNFIRSNRISSYASNGYYLAIKIN